MFLFVYLFFPLTIFFERQQGENKCKKVGECQESQTARKGERERERKLARDHRL